jgi:hypothetical protein
VSALLFWYFFPTAVPFFEVFLVDHPSAYPTAGISRGDRRLKIYKRRDNLRCCLSLSFAPARAKLGAVAASDLGLWPAAVGSWEIGSRPADWGSRRGVRQSCGEGADAVCLCGQDECGNPSDDAEQPEHGCQ